MSYMSYLTIALTLFPKINLFDFNSEKEALNAFYKRFREIRTNFWGKISDSEILTGLDDFGYLVIENDLSNCLYYWEIRKKEEK